jgi:hypothetical protein
LKRVGCLYAGDRGIPDGGVGRRIQMAATSLPEVIVRAEAGPLPAFRPLAWIAVPMEQIE